MPIVSEWELSADATWNDFIQWWGVHAGRHAEETLEYEARVGEPELAPIAQAELDRRAKLET